MLLSKRRARVTVVGDHAEVQLSKGYIAFVDLYDYDLVRDYTWSATEVKGGLVYAVNKPYQQPLVLMHRFLLGLNAQDEMLVDHWDGNGLNNRRYNLRVCKSGQNIANSKKRKNALSPFKGVSPSREGRWRAYIKVDYKFKHLGTFDSEEDAACAYDQAAIRHFGKFAAVNFPGGPG